MEKEIIALRFSFGFKSSGRITFSSISFNKFKSLSTNVDLVMT